MLVRHIGNCMKIPLCVYNGKKDGVGLSVCCAVWDSEYVWYPIQVIWCMSLLFAIMNESETAANLCDLGSVLMSLRNGLGEV